jgi:quaternary ammonium compound-resistance protein SugE
VWVGIGASLTVAYAMVTGDEPASVVKVLLIGGIVVSVAGLKLLH